MIIRWLSKVWRIFWQPAYSARLKYSDPAKKVMQLANQEANRFNHDYIGTEHLLLGILINDDSMAALVLKSLGVEPSKIRVKVETYIVRGPDMVAMGRLPLTPRARNVIKNSIDEARKLNHNYVGTEHILLGLLCEQEGFAGAVLINLGLTLQNTSKEVIRALAGKRPETSA